MKYRYIESEKIEKKRRKSTITSGVFAIIISLFCIVLGIVFLIALKSWGGMLFMSVFALIFIAAGIYFFNQIKIDEKRSRSLDDPNSRSYKKRQRYIAKKRNKYLRKAEKHRSLKSIMCRRSALIYGFFTLISSLMTFLTLALGLIMFIFLILDITLSIAFIFSLFGKYYKKLLREYEKYDFNRSEAENDFSESRAYLFSTNLIAVSSRFFTASAEFVVIPIENILWIYSAYDNIHIYKSGMYSHTERKYFVIIGLSDGRLFKINCPEELCSIIAEDVVNVGISVTYGYSDELWNLFFNEPDSFRNAIKTGMDINTKPILLQ